MSEDHFSGLRKLGELFADAIQSDIDCLVEAFGGSPESTREVPDQDPPVVSKRIVALQTKLITRTAQRDQARHERDGLRDQLAQARWERDEERKTVAALERARGNWRSDTFCEDLEASSLAWQARVRKVENLNADLHAQLTLARGEAANAWRCRDILRDMVRDQGTR